MTHDVTALQLVRKEHGWLKTYEAFAICRDCRRSTIFVIRERGDTHDTKAFENMSPLDIETTLNRHFTVQGFISLKDRSTVAPPEHVPEHIANIFREGATCLRVECWNAAGTMFRLCVDLATRPMLPDGDVPGLTSRTRRDLGLRLPWLFDNNKLPAGLRDLSTAIREDGNDGAHQGMLKKEDAENLLDFTVALLERVYTEPKQLELAKTRREERRAQKDPEPRAQR
jgi:hypothetical protein